MGRGPGSAQAFIPSEREQALCSVSAEIPNQRFLVSEPGHHRRRSLVPASSDSNDADASGDDEEEMMKPCR